MVLLSTPTNDKGLKGIGSKYFFFKVVQISIFVVAVVDDLNM